jgi:hypothetical protein
MTKYQVKFCITDAIGTFHQINCGQITVAHGENILEICETKFGKAENDAFYQVSEIKEEN